MKPSELFFCALPVWLSAGLFALIAAINFDFEWRFFEPVMIHGRVDAWLGCKMLIAAVIASVASGIFLFIMRRNFTTRRGGNKIAGWLHVVLPGIVALALCMAAVFVVILGPAALTMLQQMSN